MLKVEGKEGVWIQRCADNAAYYNTVVIRSMMVTRES